VLCWLLHDLNATKCSSVAEDLSTLWVLLLYNDDFKVDFGAEMLRFYPSLACRGRGDPVHVAMDRLTVQILNAEDAVMALVTSSGMMDCVLDAFLGCLQSYCKEEARRGAVFHVIDGTSNSLEGEVEHVLSDQISGCPSVSPTPPGALHPPHGALHCRAHLHEDRRGPPSNSQSPKGGMLFFPGRMLPQVCQSHVPFGRLWCDGAQAR
jgi:hypothetical protein